MRNIRPRHIVLAILSIVPAVAGVSAKPIMVPAIIGIKIAPASVSPPIMPGTATPSGGSPGSRGIAAGSARPAGQAGLDLAIASPLQLSAPTVASGGSLTGRATLQNQGSAPVTVSDIVIAGRPPGGTNLRGPYLDFGGSGSVTLPPGQSITVQQTRAFTSGDPTGAWYSYVTHQTTDGLWHDDPRDVSFMVTSAAADNSMKKLPPNTSSSTPVPATGALTGKPASATDATTDRPVSLSATVKSAAAATGYDWLQFGGNAQHDGNNRLETTITPSNVANLRQLYRAEITTGAANDTPTNIDGSLVFLHNVATSQGTRNLLIGNRKDGVLIAFDAATGAPLWSHATMPASCTQPESGEACHTTSSPAIDPGGQYVYAYGLDGYVHRYNVGDGTEVAGGGWPELATKKPTEEKSAASLTIASVGGTNYLYVTNGGYPEDMGDYQGHVTAINLADGSQHVFNTLCSNQIIHFDINTLLGGTDCSFVHGAVWGRGGVTYDPDTQKIYFSTGNGTYDALAPTLGHEWGDSVLALHPDGTGDGTGNPLDSYTPTNYLFMDQNDTDLGSATPAILPLPAGCTGPHYGLQSGKDAQLRVLNLDNLSGQGGVGLIGGELAAAALPQGGEMKSQIATWTDPAGNVWSFVASDSGIAAYEWTFGGCQLTQPQTDVNNPKWHNSASSGSSPLVANGVLFYAPGGALQALDPATGKVLWSDSALSGITPVQNIHWESPIVVDGVVYITDGTGAHNDNLETDGHLLAYALPSSPSATPTATATAATTDTASATPTGTATNTATATATNTASTTPTGTATGTATPLPGSLPSPWQQRDVGSAGLPGSASYAGSTFTVSGSGGDIWDVADAFHYVYQPWTGNGQIVARVVSQTTTDPWAKAGVMVRDSLDAASTFADMMVTPGNGTAFQRRVTSGGTSTSTAGPQITAPYWVKIVWQGNTFTGYVSDDGVSWALVGTDTFSMASSVYVGLAVTAHNNAALSTATFDNVTVIHRQSP